MSDRRDTLVPILRAGLGALRAGADLVLPEGEQAYADLWASGWRFEAAVVPYERRTIVVGGPMMALATGVASITGNRRRRAEAETTSVPQWRPFGVIRVVVTFDRLLVLHGGTLRGQGPR